MTSSSIDFANMNNNYSYLRIQPKTNKYKKMKNTKTQIIKQESIQEKEKLLLVLLIRAISNLSLVSIPPLIMYSDLLYNSVNNQYLYFFSSVFISYFLLFPVSFLIYDYFINPENCIIIKISKLEIYLSLFFYDCIALLFISNICTPILLFLSILYFIISFSSHLYYFLYLKKSQQNKRGFNNDK